MSPRYPYADKLRARFTVWLEKLLYHARIDYFRRRSRSVETISFDDVPDYLLTDSSGFEKNLEMLSVKTEFDFEEEWLAKAYSELPLMKRKILSMLFVEEKTPSEIAAQLHCSVQHVYNQRSLAIKKLREILLKGGDAV